MDSQEAREIRIRKVNGSACRDPGPDKETAGLIQVNGHLSRSGPRTRDLGDKDNVSTDQDAVLRRHRNPRCSRCNRADIESAPARRGMPG